MAFELPDKKTTCSVKEALEALASAWIVVLGTAAPRRESLLVLCAQWAEETGWGKAMHCNNFGNMKSVASDGRSWTYFACNEVLSKAQAERCVATARPRRDDPGRRDAVVTANLDEGKCIVWFWPSNPTCRFRAYETVAEGASDYLATLYRRFNLSWPAVLAGDPRLFAHLLRQQGYYTAPESLYANALASIFSTVGRTEFDMYPRLDADTSARAMQLVALTLAGEAHDLETLPSPPPSMPPDPEGSA